MSIEAGNDFGFQLEPSYRPEPNGGFSFVPGVEEILANMPNAMASDQPQIGCPALWAESAAGEPVILEHLRLSRQFTADVLFPTTIRLGRMLAERYDLKNYSL